MAAAFFVEAAPAAFLGGIISDGDEWIDQLTSFRTRYNKVMFIAVLDGLMQNEADGCDFSGAQHARGDEGMSYLYSRLGPCDLRSTFTPTNQNQNKPSHTYPLAPQFRQLTVSLQVE